MKREREGGVNQKFKFSHKKDRIKHRKRDSGSEWINVRKCVREREKEWEGEGERECDTEKEREWERRRVREWYMQTQRETAGPTTMSEGKKHR